MYQVEDPLGTIVVQYGWTRRILLGLALILCAAMFLGLAGVFIFVGLSGVALLAQVVLFLVAVGLVLVAAYMVTLLTVLAARIEIGPQAVALRLPRVRGPLPLFGLIHATLPYVTVLSVESRQEVYVSFGMVTVQEAYSVVTREGARFLLGIRSQSWGTGLRFDEAARQIAARAGQGVVDCGAVRVGGIIGAMMNDVPPWGSAPMPPEDQSRWVRRGAITVRLLLGLLTIGVLLRACATYH
jgi:hypothetical protein